MMVSVLVINEFARDPPAPYNNVEALHRIIESLPQFTFLSKLPLSSLNQHLIKINKF